MPFHIFNAQAIWSVIGTPAYKLVRFLIFSSFEYTIKDSIIFAEEPQSSDSKLVMASFDVESLFIPLHETIDLCVKT